MDSKNDINTKTARANKIAYKTELHAALREVVAQQRVANSAEKRAKFKEARAEKLLTKARQAQIDAEEARLRANLAAEAATEAQRLADQMLIATRKAVAKLSEAEFMEKNAKRIALKRKKTALNKMSTKLEKPRSRRTRKLVGAT